MLCRKFSAVALVVVFAIGLMIALQSPMAQAQKKITITYADWQLGQVIWGRILRESFAKFERLNPNIKVQDQPIALAQLGAKLSVAAMGGKGPDVFATTADLPRQFIDNGWVRDLTPFVQKEGGEEFLEDFYPVSLKLVTVDEKTWGIPKNIVAMMLVYNSQMFKDAGLDPGTPPANWEKFLEASKALTNPPTQWGTVIVMAKAGFDLRFPGILRGHGGSFLTKDWKRSALDTPQAKEAFNYVVDLVRKHKVMPPGPDAVGANEARRLLAPKKVAMIIGTMWTIPEVSGMNPDLHGWEVLEMTPVPIKKGLDLKTHTVLYQKSLFMGPNTEYPEEAWKLIKFITDAEQMQEWFVWQSMLSCRKSVNETFPPILQSKYAGLVAKEIPRGDFLPLIPQTPEILDTFRSALTSAVTGMEAADAALARAHAEINEILAR